MGYPEKRGKTWRARFLVPGQSTYGSESGWPTKRAAQTRADELEALAARGAWAQRHGRTSWSAHYRTADGTYHEEPGLTEQAAAQGHAEAQRAAVRSGTWRDPSGAQMTLQTWWARWRAVQEDMQLGHNTLGTYDSHWRNHIAPRWGAVELGELMGMGLEIEAWEAQLRARRAQSTANAVMKLFTLLISDAVWAGLIPLSPIRPRRRRGRMEPKRKREGIAVGLPVVVALMRRMVTADALMTLTKWCTGMRWGEVAGVRRKYLVLVPPELDAAGVKVRDAEGYYVIDPEVGALHEDSSGALFFGPPKGRKGRTVQLPPFLVELLLAYVATLEGEQVLATLPDGTAVHRREVLFGSHDGALWRRSSFSRRVWRPACDGQEARPARQGARARAAVPPVHRGLVPHDMRHSHKTWMDDRQISKGAQDERLGHADESVQDIYRHATPAERARILAELQREWEMLGEKWEIRIAS